MKVDIKLGQKGFIPVRGTSCSAGYDLFLPSDTMVRPGRQVIPLDFSIALPDGYEAEVRPRSGISIKGVEDSSGMMRDIDVIIGTIDSDYRGTVGVIVKNNDNDFYFLKGGTRIAQMVIHKVESVEWEILKELGETERGENGYGSTGLY